MKPIELIIAVLCGLLTLTAPVGGAAMIRHDAPTAGITELVSVSSDESQGNGVSVFPAISADGRFVAFHSEATNLIGVGADTNARDDVFVRDRQTGMTERVSVSSDESQGNDGSVNPSISADGRYVAFHSEATNLVGVGVDTNTARDVFVRDRVLGTTELVSVTSDEIQGNGGSVYPSISADGLYVAFWSYASNLVIGDNNNVEDIIVRDLQAGTTERVSVASDGSEGNNRSYQQPSISADGRYVAFISAATNLVGGDTNNRDDVFVHDREAGTTELVSVASDESQANYPSQYPFISANGRYVVFLSYATNLVGGDTNNVSDIFVRHLGTGWTERVSMANNQSQGNNLSEMPSISADGRFVAFRSDATNLVGNDTNGAEDIFVRDRLLRTTERVSVASDDSQANGESSQPAISADGQFVAFRSMASNLVGVDTNGFLDVFVRDRGVQPLVRTVYLPVITR